VISLTLTCASMPVGGCSYTHDDMHLYILIGRIGHSTIRGFSLFIFRHDTLALGIDTSFDISCHFSHIYLNRSIH